MSDFKEAPNGVDINVIGTDKATTITPAALLLTIKPVSLLIDVILISPNHSALISAGGLSNTMSIAIGP